METIIGNGFVGIAKPKLRLCVFVKPGMAYDMLKQLKDLTDSPIDIFEWDKHTKSHELRTTRTEVAERRR